MTLDVRQQRIRASEASAGTSSDVVYSMIEHAIVQRSLKGQVLDYGSGVGGLTRRLLGMNQFDHVVAADIMRAPDDLSGRVDWIEQDLNSPIVGYDEAFDVVVSTEVIEHLENPRFTMREISGYCDPAVRS